MCLMNLDDKNNFLCRLKNIVALYPDNVAVLEDGIKQTSYKQLWQNAHNVAYYLQKNYHQTKIGIAIDKSAEYIAAVLGCWIAKKTFIPLDRLLPENRLNYIKKNAELNSVFSLKEFESAQKNTFSGDAPFDYRIPIDYPAYIIYTSGTTGNPKGVVVSHNGIVNLADNQIKAFKTDSSSRYLFYVSISFDASLSDISVCLLSGATLVIEHLEKLSLAASITNLIKKRRITHADIPPSLLKILNVNEFANSSLKTIIIGGEPCDVDTVKKWASVVNLINVYGPTEATVCTSLIKCTKSWNEPLIGKEIDNIEYIIADENLHTLQHGPGELLISGIGLALGYLNNKDLTEKKFIFINNKRYYRTGDLVLKLKNGNIKFLGRIDRQVKIRGQLVELEEIESKLNAYPQIDRASVLYRSLIPGGAKIIVAFIKPFGDNIDISNLKKYLASYLPNYMMPSHFEIMTSLPLTSSGKIDQQKLLNYKLTPTITQPEVQSSRSEKIILNAFRKVLKFPDMSVNDSFIDCGGDSLGVIEVIITCANSGIELNPELIISQKTAREIAKYATKSSSSKISSEDFIPDTLFDNTLPTGKKTEKIHNVLITGATGFLGSKLLLELLENTDFCCYCLIRAESKQKGFKRLADTFTKYQDKSYDCYKKRIKIVCGDVGTENLGIQKNEYAILAEKIDAVYHCAAQVNMISTYEQLKNVNLEGSKRIVRFCCEMKQKPLHYASTLSVFVATNHNQGEILENDTLDKVKYIYGGYAQTKYAAEKYLLNIPKNICDIFIYRFGLITGSTTTGISSQNDFLGMFIKGAKTLGILPYDYTNSLAVDITPVDYAAKAMALISLNSTSHRIFHIANSQPLFYNQFIQILQKMHIIKRILPYADWKAEIDNKTLLTNCEQACVLALCRLNKEKYEAQRYMDLFQATNIKFNTQNTDSVTGINCPEPSENLIKKHIQKICNIPYKTGLVLGKFLPPHKGHQYLLEFANNHVDRLYIVVDNIADKIIPVKTRLKWMQTLFPDATVLTLKNELPQAPEEAPDNFWELWRKGLSDILPEKIDYVFASEDYGVTLASVLKAKFIMVDKQRITVPICATKIRDNPLKYWNYIVDVAKPYFVKKICVFGPESTGKSTLTKQLADFYKTVYVPEYAQKLIKQQNGNINYDDMEKIVVNHYKEIVLKTTEANKFLFVDTDAILSKIWSNELFGKYPKIIDEIIAKSDFDMYLLLDVDVPWVQDIHRYRPDNRKQFFEICKSQLLQYNRNFKVISGGWENRFRTAVNIVENLLGNKDKSNDGN